MDVTQEAFHSYGPTCIFYDDTKTTDDTLTDDFDKPPQVKAQFFYVSDLPIDDPLSPLPAVTSSTASTKTKPQPYSPRDNAALEEAWLGLIQSDEKQSGEQIQRDEDRGQKKSNKGDAKVAEAETKDRRSKDTSQASDAHSQETIKQSKSDPDHMNVQSTDSDAPELMLSQFPEHHAAQRPGRVDAKELAAASDKVELGSTENSKKSEIKEKVKSKKSSSRLESEVSRTDDHAAGETEDDGDPKLSRKTSKHRFRSPFRRRDKRSDQSTDGKSLIGLADSPSRPEDTSGRPFARSAGRNINRGGAFDGAEEYVRHQMDETERPINSGDEKGTHNQGPDVRTERSNFRPRFKPLTSERTVTESDSESPKQPSWLPGIRGKDVQKAYVPVGVSRLHLVEMPDLQMKPIYWNPIHDISSVVRGTWFYKENMLPVEPDVAVLLEAGYEEFRPWTKVWQEELDSCVKNGAEAELKVCHRLWPKEEEKLANRPGSGKEPQKPAKKDLVQSQVSSTKPENRAAGSSGVPDAQRRLFKNSSVMYVDARNAQILRPSVMPSVSRGRRPLGAIRAGRQIGVAIIRGWDRKAWEKINPPKNSLPTRSTATVAQSGAAMADDRHKSCPACEQDEQRTKVTDLILVIHGIGQKLSERVESFHFTHAINAFRRQVNVELASNEVKPHLRHGLGGIMVLPINWRSNLDLEIHEEGNTTYNPSGMPENNFSLRDITPETLPAVRNLISDVMLDIPYYLSHHKPKMIKAVIKEANRVYRLWCRNNPAFHQQGRVHLIAHSLGSAMAMDILSKQPTKLPREISLKSRKVASDRFEFDTKNLFFCGSPAGFFLLLNKAHLFPRKGRDKPGANGEDLDPKIVGKTGNYGCLAVDNLYNVMHYNDPIAYRVNAAVDTDYAASLKPAIIPSSSSSWISALNIFTRSPAPWSVTNTDRPPINKLPSTMELETHDFTREEIAEKRMQLLNDNGQIDWYLTSGGGPLEIQYLNMLSAHSSYWVLQDFVRFLVVEVGREPGKRSTLRALKAAKKGHLEKK